MNEVKARAVFEAMNVDVPSPMTKDAMVLLAKAIEQHVNTLSDRIRQLEEAYYEGMRVEVSDGSGSVPIGQGTIVDHVTVYVREMMSVEGLESHRMAETPFEDATPIEHNPKIQMDDGSVRYGCQVWWKPITPVEEVKDADLGIPEQE